MGDSVRGRVLWYELLTTDMKAAEKFYSDVVGWTVAPFDGAPEPYDMFMRSDRTPVAGIMTIPQGMNFPPHWEMYVGVDRLEDAVTHIERAGGSALGPQVDVPSVGRMRTMMDPQRAVFAIYEPENPPQQPEAEPKHGDGSWHELMTTDVEAGRQFYADLFGWTPSGEPYDMGPMGKYHLFGRTLPLGGMMNRTPEMGEVPPNWQLYFRVPDVHQGAERVKASGGQVINGPMEVPGGDWIVNCIDPQGAHFALHHR